LFAPNLLGFVLVMFLTVVMWRQYRPKDTLKKASRLNKQIRSFFVMLVNDHWKTSCRTGLEPDYHSSAFSSRPY